VKTAETQAFFTGGLDARKCVICGADFRATSRSRANVCSADCRRERRLRYGAQYRRQGREAHAKLLEMFGGHKPTEEEIMQLVRRGREAGEGAGK
jgi:hypothetical protein